MKNLKKISLALILVVALMLQTVCVFADVSTIYYQYGEDGSVTSFVYASGVKQGAKLYTAIYKADGTFVSSVASSEVTGAGYLTTKVTPADGQYVKSFIWDSKKNPLDKSFLYSEESIDIDGIDVKISGIKLQDYTGEELAFGETYIIPMLENDITAMPYIEATSDDSKVNVDVEYDYDNAKATNMEYSEDAQQLGAYTIFIKVTEKYPNYINHFHKDR